MAPPVHPCRKPSCHGCNALAVCCCWDSSGCYFNVRSCWRVLQGPCNVRPGGDRKTSHKCSLPGMQPGNIEFCVQPVADLHLPPHPPWDTVLLWIWLFLEKNCQKCSFQLKHKLRKVLDQVYANFTIYTSFHLSSKTKMQGMLRFPWCFKLWQKGKLRDVNSKLFLKFCLLFLDSSYQCTPASGMGWHRGR